MERRAHPSHDRVTFRRTMTCFAAAMLSMLGYGVAVEAGAGVWSWLGVVGFVAASARMVLTPVNRCPCPTCGAGLSRPPDTTEFVCHHCGVVWMTRGFGGTNWE
ncbi:MAG TPA: hypothetical protein VKE74_16180 [Gemmataceae bacterium]|nr:hypothetical protein [Gemmataceae bacterium]